MKWWLGGWIVELPSASLSSFPDDDKVGRQEGTRKLVPEDGVQLQGIETVTE